MIDSHKRELGAAFAMMEACIDIPPFRQQWLNARREVGNDFPTAAGQSGFAGRIVERIQSPAGAVTLGVFTIAFVMAAVLYLNIHRVMPADTASADNPAIPGSLDPNRPWTVPTDDLLAVNVRGYESGWFTHVIYDPLTMEIK